MHLKYKIMDKLPKEFQCDEELFHVAKHKKYGEFFSHVSKNYDAKDINWKEYALRDAIKEFDLQLVEVLLDMGVNPNFIYENGKFPLMKIKQSELGEKIFKLLLERGANVNQQDAEGLTVLHDVDAYSEKSFVDLLFEYGANPNVADKYGNTVLFYLTDCWNSYGIQEFIQRFLDEGADINHRNKMGETVLMRAVKHGCEKLVNFFISAGSKLNVVDNEGRTALFYAVESKKILRLLLRKGLNLEHQDLHGRTVFMHAFLLKKFDAVPFMIEKGANVNHLDHEGKNASMLLQK